LKAEFGRIIKVVSEALTLHAMMMTSMPYFILMKPNTLQIINAIWKFRNDTKIPVCFTLDAGANVHVLYPKTLAKSFTIY
jgi:diphosphomevalonate decarboxylase